MNKIMKRIFPVLLSVLILASIGWYLLEYDPDFTRDIILQQARNFENNGNHNASVWMYNLAYEYFGGNDDVAIELAEKFIEIGNYSKAEYTLRKAIEDGGNEQVYMALSKTYVQQGKLRDAVMMLENVTGPMKEKLESLRPAAPEASIPAGSYRQYLSLELLADAHTIFASFDNDYPSALTDAYTGPIQLTTGQTTVFTVCVGDNGLVSPLAVYSYIISDVVEAVVFSDEGFETCLRQQLGYGPDRVIYSNSLWSVKDLVLDSSVQSLSDLKWLPNLHSLSINASLLNDSEAIAGCVNLQKISIQETTVDSDTLQAISSLGALEELRLTECGISSITPLASLTGLKILDLNNNAIRDISALSGLTQLTELNLGSNALISLAGLDQLSQLRVLDVSFNSIVSITPLEQMTSLLELDLSSNALRSLSSLQNMTQLQKLYAAHNELLGLDPLASCTALTYLDVSHNTILNVDTVASLIALEEFDFSHNEVNQLPQFSEDCALRVINGSYNQIESLKRLSGLQNLTHIYMDYNEHISSVNSLTSCASLKEVYVYGTKVRSVSALTNLGVLVIYSPA